jgi:hypothetical protein
LVEGYYVPGLCQSRTSNSVHVDIFSWQEAGTVFLFN